MTNALSIINPATEQPVGSVDMLSLEEADRAIERAHAAAAAWRAVTPADRARLLRRFSETVDAQIEELAQLEVANSGHTISNARWEAGNVRDVLAYYSRRGRCRPHVLRAARCRGHHRALEFSNAHRRMGTRPGLGRRKHRGPKAGHTDPAHRRAIGAVGPRGRSSRGRLPSPSR